MIDRKWQKKITKYHKTSKGKMWFVSEVEWEQINKLEISVNWKLFSIYYKWKNIYIIFFILTCMQSQNQVTYIDYWTWYLDVGGGKDPRG